MAIAELEIRTNERPLTTVLHEWLTTVDHKRLGILYILTTFVFLAAGGVEALIIRAQLIQAVQP